MAWVLESSGPSSQLTSGEGLLQQGDGLGGLVCPYVSVGQIVPCLHRVWVIGARYSFPPLSVCSNSGIASAIRPAS